MFGIKWCSHCYHRKKDDSVLILFKSDCVENPWTVRDPNHSWGFNHLISVYVCCKCKKVRLERRPCMVENTITTPKIAENEIKAFKQEMIEKYGGKS